MLGAVDDGLALDRSKRNDLILRIAAKNVVAVGRIVIGIGRRCAEAAAHRIGAGHFNAR